ncbi:hypothetical protein [Patiriisocius sp. Uisw_017]|jgi:hypothetical protein|uniref:hypothetical protein n=1 Tax=Patiriisocius sp. Uisw_017 TaxID=3230968 RepID=UPI0039E900D1
MKKGITILALLFFVVNINAQVQLGLETTSYNKIMSEVDRIGYSTVLDMPTTYRYSRFKSLIYVTIGNIMHEYKEELGTRETFSFNGQECLQVKVVNVDNGTLATIIICPNDGMLILEDKIKQYFFDTTTLKKPKTKAKNLFSRFRNLLDEQ